MKASHCTYAVDAHETGSRNSVMVTLCLSAPFLLCIGLVGSLPWVAG